jgi:hypothetical protein
VNGIENQDRQTLNFRGFAHGLSTAGRLPALEARWRPTVDNPAPCLLNHKTKDNIPFRSPVQHCAGLTSVKTERTTYIGESHHRQLMADSVNPQHSIVIQTNDSLQKT